MEVLAKLRFLKISPPKVRLVIDIVRGLSVKDAEAQLQFMNKRAALPVLKLIRSAVANAEHNDKLKKEDLRIKRIMVDQGPTLHRWRPRAYGRAAPIQKRSSHVTVVLENMPGTGPKAAKGNKEKVVPAVKTDSKAGTVKKASPKSGKKQPIKQAVKPPVKKQSLAKPDSVKKSKKK
ncbi:MAG: 50S ribosomal protein L22 [Patescibacteria group bacterium]